MGLECFSIQKFAIIVACLSIVARSIPTDPYSNLPVILLVEVVVLDGQESVGCSVVAPVELQVVIAGRIFDCILGLGIEDRVQVVDIAVRIVVPAVVAGRFVVHLRTLNLLQHHLQEGWC